AVGNAALLDEAYPIGNSKKALGRRAVPAAGCPATSACGRPSARRHTQGDRCLAEYLGHSRRLGRSSSATGFGYRRGRLFVRRRLAAGIQPNRRSGCLAGTFGTLANIAGRQPGPDRTPAAPAGNRTATENRTGNSAETDRSGESHLRRAHAARSSRIFGER